MSNSLGAALEHARDPGADPALLVLAHALEEAMAHIAEIEKAGTNPGQWREGALRLVLR